MIVYGSMWCQLPLHSTVQRMHGEHRDTECNACKPMPHDYWYLSRRVQCHVYSLKEGSFGSKKGSIPFKDCLERTPLLIATGTLKA